MNLAPKILTGIWLSDIILVTFVLATFVHIKNISAVTDPFLPSFKGRLLEPSIKAANSYGNICPINICPNDMSPYQEYLSCYRLNFDQTLKVD